MALDVNPRERKWKMARTEVFNIIEEDVMHCQAYSKAMICVDEVGIGKSYAARYLARTLKNCFYVDCKQAKTKQQFIRLIAKTIGVDNTGTFMQVKETLKYYIRLLPAPIIIVDDTGYLEYNTYMELLELWDATEGYCGWYQIGDDSLRNKIERGMNHKKVGYKAIFSRYSKRYTNITPTGVEEKKSFYKKLITEVLSVNMPDKTDLNELVKRCMITDMPNSYGDLRRAESLLQIYLNSKQ
jgi:type II secretory pathway predicted ATPase ExeA